MNRLSGEHTREGKDGAVGAAARQEVGHVAAPGVDEDGARIEVVGHLRSARTQFLAHSPVQPVRELRQHYLPMLLLPAQPHATSQCSPRMGKEAMQGEPMMGPAPLLAMLFARLVIPLLDFCAVTRLAQKPRV